MSDYNRGPYTKASERPLAFEDRRQPRRGGGRPAPVTLILSLVLLLAVGGGVYYMYRSGTRAPGEAPQPVGAPVRDVKVAAPPQAPAQDPAVGLSVYKDNQGEPVAAPAFVAPPEQPTPRPGAAEPAPPASPLSSSPAGATPVAPAPATAHAVVAAARPAVTPPAKPVTIDKILADNSDVRSPTRPLVKPAARPAPTPTVAPPVAQASTPRSAAAVAGAGAMVQIGAFSTKALADAGWNTAASTAPGAMAGKGKHVVPITKADGSILYRTSITGFATRADAAALCGKLRAAGGSCFVR